MNYQFSLPQLEWLAALRSGKYKQGTAYLAYRPFQDDISYCCLGVACEINPDLQRTQHDVTGMNAGFETRFEGCGSLLPIVVMNQLNVTSSGRFRTAISRGDKCYYSLAEVNDSGLFTFEEIADMIEQNPENVFWLD